MERDPSRITAPLLTIATAQGVKLPNDEERHHAQLVESGPYGSARSGRACAESLSAEARSESVHRSATARWSRPDATE